MAAVAVRVGKDGVDGLAAGSWVLAGAQRRMNNYERDKTKEREEKIRRARRWPITTWH